MENFGGYTAQAGNIFGYWRDDRGRDSYGEHREFSVAFVEDSRTPRRSNNLSRRWPWNSPEECIYLRAGNVASLIYPAA